MIATHVDHHRTEDIIGSSQPGPFLRMWALSDQVNQARFCRNTYAIWQLSESWRYRHLLWQLWTADLGGVPQIPNLNRKIQPVFPKS